MIVLDASAAVDLLLSLGAYERIQDRLDEPGETVHAPFLLDIEVAQALRRLVSRGRVDPDEAATALQDIGEMAIVRYPHLPLLGRVWELRANVSAFDAAYVALAEALGAPLVTSDARLARAPGILAKLEVYS